MDRSYKDWIAGIRKARGRFRDLQEDILADDGFPDTEDRDEMIAYLKRNNASDLIISIFLQSYKRYYERIVNKKGVNNVHTDRIRRYRESR